MIETNVLRAIIGGAISAIGADYPIKAPGRVFTPPNNQKYVEIIIIRDRNGNESWGQEQLFSGDVTLILHWPLNADDGIYVATEAIAAIAARLPKGARFQHNQANLLITDHARLNDPIEERADMLYSAIVPYSYYHAPA